MHVDGERYSIYIYPGGFLIILLLFFRPYSGTLKELSESKSDAFVWRYVFELYDNGLKKSYALHVTNNNIFTALEVGYFFRPIIFICIK